jgi:hypothetical protein
MPWGLSEKFRDHISWVVAALEKSPHLENTYNNRLFTSHRVAH